MRREGSVPPTSKMIAMIGGGMMMLGMLTGGAMRMEPAGAPGAPYLASVDLGAATDGMQV